MSGQGQVFEHTPEHRFAGSIFRRAPVNRTRHARSCRIVFIIPTSQNLICVSLGWDSTHLHVEGKAALPNCAGDLSHPSLSEHRVGEHMVPPRYTRMTKFR